eukprot:15349744-Ditylum_brightwellii.AAC.1
MGNRINYRTPSTSGGRRPGQCFTGGNQSIPCLRQRRSGWTRLFWMGDRNAYRRTCTPQRPRGRQPQSN